MEKLSGFPGGFEAQAIFEFVESPSSQNCVLSDSYGFSGFSSMIYKILIVQCEITSTNWIQNMIELPDAVP